MPDFGIVVPFELNDIDVWSGREIDLDAYRYTLKGFGLNKLIVINLAGAKLPTSKAFDQEMDYRVLDTYEEFFEQELGRSQLTLFEPQWEFGSHYAPTALQDLSHSKEGWYVFGPAMGFDKSWVDLDIRYSYMPMIPRCAWHTTHLVAAVLWDRQKAISYGSNI